MVSFKATSILFNQLRGNTCFERELFSASCLELIAPGFSPELSVSKLVVVEVMVKAVQVPGGSECVSKNVGLIWQLSIEIRKEESSERQQCGQSS